jgi:hypothetical protein
VDIAERMVHDLLLNARSYRHGMPRLRLFCIFLRSHDEELDDVVQSVLASPQALAVYENLVMEFHYQLFLDKKKAQAEEQLMANLMLKAATEDKITLKDLNNQSSFMIKADRQQPPKPEVPECIESFFVSSESPFSQAERKDTWYMPLLSLTAAINRWSKAQNGIDVNANIYVDAIDKMKVSPMGADVDDVLWLVMIQWAKVMHWYFKRAATKAQMCDKNSDLAKAILHSPNDKITKHISQRFSQEFINKLVESVYRPGEGQHIVNPKVYSAVYLSKAMHGLYNHLTKIKFKLILIKLKYKNTWKIKIKNYRNHNI